MSLAPVPEKTGVVASAVDAGDQRGGHRRQRRAVAGDLGDDVLQAAELAARGGRQRRGRRHRDRRLGDQRGRGAAEGHLDHARVGFLPSGPSVGSAVTETWPYCESWSSSRSRRSSRSLGSAPDWTAWLMRSLSWASSVGDRLDRAVVAEHVRDRVGRLLGRRREVGVQRVEPAAPGSAPAPTTAALAAAARSGWRRACSTPSRSCRAACRGRRRCSVPSRLCTVVSRWAVDLGLRRRPCSARGTGGPGSRAQAAVVEDVDALAELRAGAVLLGARADLQATAPRRRRPAGGCSRRCSTLAMLCET